MCVCVRARDSSAASALIHCESKNFILPYRICVCESRHQSSPALPLFLKIKYTKSVGGEEIKLCTECTYLGTKIDQSGDNTTEKETQN